MITPGGSPGTSFNQGAMTRFNNGELNAQRAAMPLNLAAQMTLRNQTSASHPSGPPVVNNPVQQLTAPQAPVASPPVMPQSPVPSPEAVQNNVLNQIVGSIRTQQFMNSPRVKDSQQAVRLKAFFNEGNIDAKPDTRSFFDKVVSRVQNGLAK
jgi:hypothetical protein